MLVAVGAAVDDFVSALAGCVLPLSGKTPARLPSFVKYCGMICGRLLDYSGQLVQSLSERFGTLDRGSLPVCWLPAATAVTFSIILW